MKLKLLIIILVLPILAQTQTRPHKAQIKPVSDSYFNQTITDPYRWLEDSKSPEVVSWTKQQADYADAYLKKLPSRDSIYTELGNLNKEGMVVYWVKKRGGRYFYVKKKPGGNHLEIYCRDNASASERLLATPGNFTKEGQQAAIITYTPSPNGKYVAFLVSKGGAEYGSIYIVDAATGKLTSDTIAYTRWDSGNWTSDSKAFSYLKFNREATEAESLMKIKSYLHVLGTKENADNGIFGYGLNPSVPLDPALSPAVFFSPDGQYAIAQANDGVSHASQFYMTAASGMAQTVVPWHQITKFEDEVQEVTEHNGYLYMLTYKNAPRYKIVRVPVKDPAITNAELVYESKKGIVKRMAFGKEALYIDVSEGGLWQVQRIDYKILTAKATKLQTQGSEYVRDAFPDREGILMGADSWTKSNVVLEYDSNGKVSNTGILPAIPTDMSNITVENINVASHDGAQVPVVLLYSKSMKRDGSNPTLMATYGSYGAESTPPTFYQQGLPWLRRGGIIAIVGVRGGGEYGETWHQAGSHELKPNSWKDFIAVAEYLIDKKYTSARHIGIEGTSAGGIVMSNAIAERPDLFKAAIINVGLNNMLRAETTPNGRANIEEFGTIGTPQGFRDVLAMDGYHKIKEGIGYPAVLLTHGANDPRVPAWMSAKLAARLQAALPQTAPVLLSIDYDAGHGIGASQDQINQQRANGYAFLLEQLK